MAGTERVICAQVTQKYPCMMWKWIRGPAVFHPSLKKRADIWLWLMTDLEGGAFLYTLRDESKNRGEKVSPAAVLALIGGLTRNLIPLSWSAKRKKKDEWFQLVHNVECAEVTKIMLVNITFIQSKTQKGNCLYDLQCKVRTTYDCFLIHANNSLIVYPF